MTTTPVRSAARRIRRGGRAARRRPLLVLDDGRTVHLRLLHPADGPALTGFYAGADPVDLRRRFMGQPPTPAFVLRRLEATDGVHHAMVGAFADDGRLVAVVQWDRPADDPSAEVAIEVAHDWQRHGLGTRLMLHAGDLARACGVTTFTATFFADNLGIRRLLRDTRRLVTSDVSTGEGHAVLTLEDVAATGRTRRSS